MKELAYASVVYFPAFVAGKWLCDHVPAFDPFTVGWMVAAAAVCLRWSILDRRSHTR